MTKSIFTLLLFLLVLSSCDKDNNSILSNPNTNLVIIKKGVFGLRDASLLSDLSAEYTRVIIWDTDLRAIYNEVDSGIPLENNIYYNQIKNIHNNGIKIILTLRWPDQSSSDPALYDRVPVSNDKIESLDLLSRFLNDFGPLLDIYSVQNEVGGLGPGTYSQSDMINNGNGSPAVLWWKDVVSKINTIKQNNS